MEKINCLICNSESSKKFISLKDRFNTTNEVFSLVKCLCGFVYLNPRPGDKDILKYYNTNKYDPHNKVGLLYRIVQKISFFWKISVIKKIFNKKETSILDYGAGKGDFAYYLNKKKYKIDIYEPILNNRDFNDSIKIYSNNKDIKASYDLITFWHSLEHIHDIDDLFDIIQNILKNDGFLFIAVPNLNAIERTYFGKNWAAYDAPRHLYHFNYQSMSKMLDKYNFEIVDSKAMYQDTPYNIFLSFNTKSFSSYFKFLYYSIISLFKILFINREVASSVLYICKRK